MKKHITTILSTIFILFLLFHLPARWGQYKEPRAEPRSPAGSSEELREKQEERTVQEKQEEKSEQEQPSKDQNDQQNS